MLAPAQPLGESRRRIGLERDLVGRHQPRVGRRLPAPAAIDLIPLVAVADALDAVLDARARDLLAGVVDRNDVELGVDALARVAALEGGADADIGVARADRHGLVGLGGTTAAGFEDANLDLGAQRQDGILDLVAAPFEARLADLIRFRSLQFDEGRLELGTLLVRPEHVFGEGREGLRIDRHPHVGVDRKVGRRRAVEEVGLDVEGVELAGAQDLGLRCHLDLELLRDKILDREFDAADRCGLGIDMRRRRPAATSRGFRQVDSLIERPRALQGMSEACELAAVRPLHDQGDRHVGQRIAAVVADHGHELHSLAGPVDAALGIEKGIDRAGLRTAIDAAVRQIERGLGEFEAREVLAGRILRHDGDRLGGAAAFQKARREGGAAILRRDGLAERFVAARQNHDLDAGQRLGSLQGAGKDVQPVVAGKAREADIGVDHPHAGGDAVVVLVVVTARRRLGGVPDHDEISAGLPVLDGLADREGGHDGLVGHVAHFHRAAPLFGAVAAVQPVHQRPRFGDRLRSGEADIVVAVGRKAVDAALVHAIDRDGDLGNVDAGHRQAGGAAARQDEALARQGHDGGTGAERHGHDLFVLQLLAIAAGQAGKQLHLVILTVGKTCDAQAIVDDAHCGTGFRREADIVAVLHVAGGQLLVEGLARFGFGAARVDAVTAIGEAIAGECRRLSDRRRRRIGRRRCCGGGGRRGRRWRRCGRRRRRGGARRCGTVHRIARHADQVSRNAGAQHQGYDQGSQRRTIHEEPPQKAPDHRPWIVQTLWSLMAGPQFSQAVARRSRCG